MKKLSQKEFNRRCNEVFLSREGDEYYCIEEVYSDGRVNIIMSEVENDEKFMFTYVANMKERSEALDYLLGKRDDFHD